MKDPNKVEKVKTIFTFIWRLIKWIVNYKKKKKNETEMDN